MVRYFDDSCRWRFSKPCGKTSVVVESIGEGDKAAVFSPACKVQYDLIVVVISSCPKAFSRCLKVKEPIHSFTSRKPSGRDSSIAQDRLWRHDSLGQTCSPAPEV